MQVGYLSANPFAPDAEQFTLTPEQKRAARIRDAAPELLAALQNIQEQTVTDIGGIGRDEALDLIGYVERVARAAIAKVG